MNDFERVKSDSFVTIANSFLKDKNLSNKAKGVLAMILALPDNWDFCIKGMVSITKDGEASLRSAINEMKENGYCAMKPVRINNKIARWKYLFSGEKLTEKLLCDFLQVENLNVENQAQYNNIINEEKVKNKKSISNDIPKKEQRHKNFVKPTIEEIEAYIKSMGYKSSAEEFFNYHEAGGWVIGRNRPMIDWRAAVRTWESKERKKRPTAYDVNPEDKIKEIKFKSYMREKYPDIETAHKPLSFDGYMELIHDYGVDYVTDKLDHIVTYFGKYKGCDIYKLIKSWLSEDGRE